MAFSGALTLTDLNDFITPSQACIKPVEQVFEEEDAKPQEGAAVTQIQIDSSGAYHEVSVGSREQARPQTKKLKKAEISLNDCLACSGCITSAESVLITQQSHLEVFSVLSSNPPPSSPDHRTPVLSVSPQSLASLSASLSPSPPPIRILRRVQAFAKQIGFHRTYDTTFARHLSLLEQNREFVERKRGKDVDMRLPMLASACPGWVCYAEKTHAEMIPFMSRTKSPQQVMGTLVKEWMGGKWGKTPAQIYHVSVMPCYDKKLEASRQDFYNDLHATRDVDCVVTTGELETMMRERGWDLTKPVPGEDLGETAYYAHDQTAIPELLCHPGTSSGSYLHSLMSTLAASHPRETTLTTRTIRTSDYEEFVLSDKETGAVVFKGAKCYGFRNLQNVVRKVGRETGVQVSKGAAAGRMGGGARRQRLTTSSSAADESRGYDFVEVMACPGGCVNGGGQIRPNSRQKRDAETGNRDEEGYSRDWSLEGVERPSPIVAEEDAPNQGFAANGFSGVSPRPTIVNNPEDGMTSSAARWGDKAWTHRVEGLYWHGLPTLPVSPPLTPPPPALESEESDRVSTTIPRSSDRSFPRSRSTTTTTTATTLIPSARDPKGLCSSPSAGLSVSASSSEADGLALNILGELCRGSDARQTGPGDQDDVIPPALQRSTDAVVAWTDTMDDRGEQRCRHLFRTQFRAVKSDVLGLNVKW